MARPNTRSIHGTARHGDPNDDPTTQVSLQRDGYAQGSSDALKKGASRTDFSSIFDIAGRGTGEQIDNIAIGLVSNDSSADVLATVPVGQNLDFPQGFKISNFEFNEGDNKLNTTASDSPYVWGPNTLVPKELLDNPNHPVGPVPQPVHHFTKASDVKLLPDGEDLFDTTGYGVSNVNNDPRKNYTGQNVLKLRASTDAAVQSKLGEYINTDTYEYDE
tara:strand:- start:333 stop:986 length:654 start_codon:yes stop_codon:yes gene_type:complete